MAKPRTDIEAIWPDISAGCETLHNLPRDGQLVESGSDLRVQRASARSQCHS